MLVDNKVSATCSTATWNLSVTFERRGEIMKLVKGILYSCLYYNCIMVLIVFLSFIVIFVCMFLFFLLWASAVYQGWLIDPLIYANNDKISYCNAINDDNTIQYKNNIIKTSQEDHLFVSVSRAFSIPSTGSHGLFPSCNIPCLRRCTPVK